MADYKDFNNSATGQLLNEFVFRARFADCVSVTVTGDATRYFLKGRPDITYKAQFTQKYILDSPLELDVLQRLFHLLDTQRNLLSPAQFNALCADWEVK